MIDFFGWKNGSICTEYVSSSKLAPGCLAKPKESSGNKEVMLKHPDLEEEKPPLDEDNAMYSSAGMPFSVGSSSMANQKAMSEASIKQAISSHSCCCKWQCQQKFVILSNMSGGFITL
jgi:hypothetical protein